MGDFNHHRLKFLEMGVAVVVDFELEAIAFFSFYLVFPSSVENGKRPKTVLCVISVKLASTPI